MKFSMVMHLGPPQLVSHQNEWNLKIQYGRKLPYWKIKKLWYLRNYLTNFTEIWKGNASQHFALYQLLKFLEFKNARWRMADIFKLQYLVCEKLTIFLYGQCFHKQWVQDGGICQETTNSAFCSNLYDKSHTHKQTILRLSSILSGISNRQPLFIVCTRTVFKNYRLFLCMCMSPKWQQNVRKRLSTVDKVSNWQHDEQSDHQHACGYLNLLKYRHSYFSTMRFIVQHL